MKKVFRITLALVYVATTATIFSSCRKNVDPVATSASTDTLAQTSYMVSRNNASSDGVILVAPGINADSSELMIMDGAGHLLKNKYTRSASCFNKWVINGNVRYTWIENDPSVFRPASNLIEGQAVIADENLIELKRVTLQAHADISTAMNNSVDMHDFILLDDDHYLTMSYYVKPVQNVPASLSPQLGMQVIAPVIQEVENGQVIWQWDGSNYPEFYSTSVEGNDYTNTGIAQDYMHMNSMIIDPRDNNLICSFRNLNQIIKIDRHNGDIMWRLGGANSDFPLSASQSFLRQHNVTLTDNNQTLLVFDNGEIHERAYTRILEFQLDEVNMQVTGYKSYKVPEPQTLYMGSVQKFGNHYFIGGGTAAYVLEVNFTTGEKVLEMTGATTYRAYKY